MKTVKILIYGPKESGKTSIIRKTLMKDPASQLARIPPTVLIQHVRDYKYEDYNCSFFDCGGQLKFFDRYNAELADKVFRKVTIFFFVVDSRFYFDEDLRNELEEGRKQQDALDIARKRYKKVAQKEFWRAIHQIYEYSGDTIKIIALLAHKKDLEDVLDPNRLKNELISKPSKELIPKIDQFYSDVQGIIKNIPVFATSIKDASELTSLSSAEKVVFSFLDKLKDVIKVDQETIVYGDEIRGILEASNLKFGFEGSLVVDIDDPELSVYAYQKGPEIRSYIWQIELDSMGVLGALGDKNAPENVFIVGSRFYVNIIKISEGRRLVTILKRENQDLGQKFKEIYQLSEQVKTIKIK